MRDLGKIYYETSDWQQAMWYELGSIARRSKFDDSRVEKALDLGCGSGGRTAQFKELFPKLKKVMAIDSNSQMIADALRRKKSASIQYQLLNIDEIDSLSGTIYDAIVAAWTLHWISDKQRLMKNLELLTSEKSYLFVSTCERLPDLLQMFDQELRTHFKINEETPFHFLNWGNWEQLLRSYGWKVLAHQSRTIKHRVTERQSFLKHWYAASVGAAFYKKSFATLEKDFFDQLMPKLDQKFSGSFEDSWEFPEATLFFVATREK